MTTNKPGPHQWQWMVAALRVSMLPISISTLMLGAVTWAMNAGVNPNITALMMLASGVTISILGFWAAYRIYKM